jgi:hypothetical protein
VIAKSLSRWGNFKIGYNLVQKLLLKHRKNVILFAPIADIKCHIVHRQMYIERSLIGTKFVLTILLFESSQYMTELGYGIFIREWFL